MLECPKCDEAMVTRDRNGIMIEECSGCRGVYLDRGELELLIDAESKYLAALPAGENADTTYQGRHRHGVVRQVFGEPDNGGGPNGGGAKSNSARAGADQTGGEIGRNYGTNGDAAGRNSVTGAGGQ
jgi:uncharacterized protein